MLCYCILQFHDSVEFYKVRGSGREGGRKEEGGGGEREHITFCITDWSERMILINTLKPRA